MSLFWMHQAKAGYGTDSVSDIDTTGLLAGTQYTDTALQQTYIWNGTTWEPLSAAVSAPTPGGADTEVQFNNAGTLDGASDLAWDETSSRLTLDGILNLPLLNESPVSPEAGDVWLVQEPVAGNPIGVLLALTYATSGAPLTLYVYDGIANRSVALT